MTNKAAKEFLAKWRPNDNYYGSLFRKELNAALREERGRLIKEYGLETKESYKCPECKAWHLKTAAIRRM